MEYLDILNTQGEKVGISRTYDDTHSEGLIHRSVHVWIINSQGKILIQKRHASREAYPGYWDISVAGHISSGQTSLEAVQRETKEELGIKLPASNFTYLFTLEECLVLNNGTYINNEFQDVYVVQKDITISDIQLTDGEVEAVKFVDLDEFKKMMNRQGELLIPHKEEHQRLIEYIKKTSRYI